LRIAPGFGCIAEVSVFGFLAFPELSNAIAEQVGYTSLADKEKAHSFGLSLPCIAVLVEEGLASGFEADLQRLRRIQERQGCRMPDPFALGFAVSQHMSVPLEIPCLDVYYVSPILPVFLDIIKSIIIFIIHKLYAHQRMR
jgi:hypothetical protein